MASFVSRKVALPPSHREQFLPGRDIHHPVKEGFKSRQIGGLLDDRQRVLRWDAESLLSELQENGHLLLGSRFWYSV